jgi:predicted AAA+ superfamily ATPase
MGRNPEGSRFLEPATTAAFRASYPFHPEVLDTLTTKTATLQNLQRLLNTR